MSNKVVMLGNEAIAHGLIESGCHVVTSYPGTPSSEILPETVRLKKKHGLNIHTEWSVNEKVAFDVALGASYAGKRSAVIMKQVGLNVAADSLMSSAYTGVVGGFVIISCDDPGPHSSQTEQDTRFFAMFAKVPVLDPSDPREAKKLVKVAFELSERHQIPVILRPAIRVCHAKQAVEVAAPVIIKRPAKFKKNPDRWAATPKFRLQLHKELNRKLERIREEFESTDRTDYTNCTACLAKLPKGKRYDLGIVAGGVSYAHVRDVVDENRLTAEIPIMKITAAYPAPLRLVNKFVERCRHVLVLEEPEEVIELQIVDKRKLLGRFNGFVPRAGELTPEVVHSILRKAMKDSGLKKHIPAPGTAVDEAVKEMKLPGRRPTLCAGCPHRASFFAIRKAFPKCSAGFQPAESPLERGVPAEGGDGVCRSDTEVLEPIFTSDIGCYTLGLNLGGVDTCLDMGAGITLANGFYQAFAQDGRSVPIVATIGDSTFFHAGVPPLINAVYNKAAFVLVILDNSITAMTGMQPTPDLGVMADGSEGHKVPIEQVVAGCGVDFIKVCDPYDIKGMVKLLREAYEYATGESEMRNAECGMRNTACSVRQPSRDRDGATAPESPGNRAATVRGRPNDPRVAVIIARHPCVIKYKDAVRRVKTAVTIDESLCKGCKLCLKEFECPALVFVAAKKKVTIDARLCVGCGVCVYACKAEAIAAN